MCVLNGFACTDACGCRECKNLGNENDDNDIKDDRDSNVESDSDSDIFEDDF